ncbi:virulence factor TspB C-terminal domain-related protein [Xanthomonas translucens]|uniref:virulence factor TspB C-terminal domain-related protein n=1 Tax=Xanthomonas campestris pv. translucens TaxID=343 RepID=UPI000AE8EC99|nr:virulence factor TspB C-terminal domain-related protein [Xanthomonas translucens]
MRVLDGTRHSLFRLIVGVALCVFFVGQVYAGAKVTPTSTGYYRMGTNAQGGTVWGTRSEFNAMWESATGEAVARSVTAVGEVGPATLGSLARKALRGGVYGAAVGLAVEGIIQGAGWAIGELKDQVVTPDSRTEIPTGTEAWCYTGGSELLCSTTAQSLCSAHYRGTIVDDGGSYKICSVPNVAVYTIVRVSLQQPTPDSGTGSPPRTVTDTELGDRLRDRPDIVNDLLIDPRTGFPIPTPELDAQARRIADDIDAREGLQPEPVTPPVNVDDDTPQSTETDWPTFCGWASKVCDFMDWYKSDDSTKQELPERDIDINPNGWSSGISGGSCPSSETFTLNVVGSQAQGEFSWQPLCDFSTTLRPFLIAVASVSAALILAGLRSSTPK